MVLIVNCQSSIVNFNIMTTIDIIILIIVGAGVVTGFMKGFIRQLASILGLVVGCWQQRLCMQRWQRSFVRL